MSFPCQYQVLSALFHLETATLLLSLLRHELYYYYKFCLADYCLKVPSENNCLRLSSFTSMYAANDETTTCSTILALRIVETLGSCLIIVLGKKPLTTATRLDFIQDGGI